MLMSELSLIEPELMDDTAMAEADCCASNHRINNMTLTAGFKDIVNI